MSIVYVLVACDVGLEKSVIDKLKSVDLVKDIIGVMGSYDILVKLESENSDDLKNIITSKIRKIPDIKTTLTLTVIESQE
ncbi:putative homocitrate synthase protein [Marine Group I thaumarchaeote SCGC AAA799-E16]|uniref:Putative homocitrate synthase protein n=4 Tax=Marine Group I TaxID=905826 RepID=A0A087S758_9ARCH|nr:putative homocitrate synthase protein [Marine Group I thaumarchaeote SCGC AAA799-E16]KFM17338.1 putative homocitrate synthase protein [Marine Group I thaumarchaeote SCGC AAA799-D11]KFM19358.1 putative homocitrate synthase protein [Marine Group I thaumarchaeote SCGC RSA3]KFM21562.1 putative homocitrate synthase protein [Marine Group I thaumarchaeote SCGC AAA799-B03]